MSPRLIVSLFSVVLCNLACTDERPQLPTKKLPPTAPPAPPVSPPTTPEMPSAPGAAEDDEHGEAAPAEEDPRVSRYRADLPRIEPSLTKERIEKEVAKFASDLERAETIPFPATHADCATLLGTGAERPCVLVAGDVLKPKWFAGCKAAGGPVTKNTAPAGTPLHYDTELCSKIFLVGQ